MTNIILYQVGSKSKNPATGQFYEPWKNHIWLCVEQIRKWNPTTPIHIITDNTPVADQEKFDKFEVKRHFMEDLETKHDVLGSSYYIQDTNPIYRWGGLRSFYIQALMEKYNIENVFTFDNDVLIYFDVNLVSSILNNLYYRTAITPDSRDKMVFGMCYIKNHQSMSQIVDDMWDIINKKNGKSYPDMDLWQMVSIKRGKNFVDTLPIWMEGEFSLNCEKIGGIFDPSSIGQYLLGCANGNPPRCLFPHHHIHNKLGRGKYQFIQGKEQDKKYIKILDQITNIETKILSIHVHCKRLQELM